LFKSILTFWNDFWFKPKSLINLALMRITVSMVMGFMYLSRHKDVELYFTENGLLPKAQSLIAMIDFYRSPFFIANWPDQWIGFIHLSFVVGLFVFMLGIGGRFLNLVLFVLHIAFLQRNYSIAFGADLVGGTFLLLLMGTNCCASLNVYDLVRFLKTKNNFKLINANSTDLLTPVFYRLIQIQLCVIYAYTGFEKLKGVSWWDGTALWTVLANPQMVIFDFYWLRHVPLLIVALTFITILFEIYFPILVTIKRIRPYVMTFGFLFHLGIGLVMSLWGFAFLMLSAYFLWINPILWIDRFKFIKAKG
jgi:hypothetical protein